MRQDVLVGESEALQGGCMRRYQGTDGRNMDETGCERKCMKEREGLYSPDESAGTRETGHP